MDKTKSARRQPMAASVACRIILIRSKDFRHCPVFATGRCSSLALAQCYPSFPPAGGNDRDETKCNGKPTCSLPWRTWRMSRPSGLPASDPQNRSRRRAGTSTWTAPYRPTSSNHDRHHDRIGPCRLPTPAGRRLSHLLVATCRPPRARSVASAIRCGRRSRLRREPAKGGRIVNVAPVEGLP